MEVADRVLNFYDNVDDNNVLILVLMEVAHRVISIQKIISALLRINPCSDGCCSPGELCGDYVDVDHMS